MTSSPLRRHGATSFKVFVAVVFFFTMVNVLVQIRSCTCRDRDSHLKLPLDPTLRKEGRQVLNSFRNENGVIIVNQGQAGDTGDDEEEGEDGEDNKVDAIADHPKLPRLAVALPKPDVEARRLEENDDQINLNIPEKIDWNNYTFIELEKKRTGHGEQGQPVVLDLDPAEKVKEKELYDANGYNAYVSDAISLDRSVPDIRHPQCRHRLYLKNLPNVSVIIPFHNEHWSTLLRTVHSVVNRSPPELLVEVILADDFSTKDFLKTPLDDYVRTHFKNVRVSRPKVREGAIRTRNRGALASKGTVLVFLDSHVEAGVNWLPPLLEPLANNPRTVVCPFIDITAHDTFATRPQDQGARGAFDWQLDYKRLPLLPEDLANPTRPFRSPVLAGGLFALHRSWWMELGGMDPGLEIWGGEQYDISFKIWLCGGEILDAPCSRFYHVYKGAWPSFQVGYDFLGKNYKRVAEAWMGEYARYVYMQRPGTENHDAGDISELRALQARLECKPFSFFMAEVAPDVMAKFPPPGVPVARGQVRSLVVERCWEASVEDSSLHHAPCSESAHQHFKFSTLRELRLEGSPLCVDVPAVSSGVPLTLALCRAGGGNQAFRYNPETSQLMQAQGLCVEEETSGSLHLQPCNVDSPGQKWSFTEPDQQKLLEAWQH